MTVKNGLKLVSYHNAGHAVATALVERAGSESSCLSEAHRTRWSAEYEALTALAGVIGERLCAGRVEPEGAKTDLALAFSHVAKLTQIPGEQAAYVSLLNARAEHLLNAQRAFIEHVARESELSGRDPNEIARADVDRFVA